MTEEGFDFGPIIDAVIARSTVGFVNIDTGMPAPAGSGTLVKSKTIHGILTCAHVLESLAGQSQIGLCLFPVDTGRFQNFKVEFSKIAQASITFFEKPFSANGPDLAFLPLPPDLMANLGAVGSVVDLDIQAKRAFEQLPSGTEGQDVAAGIVASLMQPASVHQSEIKLNIEALAVSGLITDKRPSNGFDLITLEPWPVPDTAMPESYKGMSGGGIWRLMLRLKPDGNFEHSEIRLMGVTFWETDFPGRKIIGHGRNSLYKKLLPEMYVRWPM